MQIILNENDIHQALKEFINHKGHDLSGCSTSVTLVAGRGVNGHSAVIDIEDAVTEKVAKIDGATGEPVEENQQAINFKFQSNDD
jgi:hypothetical protein